ncbi:MAG: NADH-quinone oxidoreductase subunit NuoG, partial [Bryobacteraceae bacterium]
MDLVKLTIDGRAIEAAPGTLVIDAAKRAGIEIPAFCYYEGLSLQAACRMCLVEVEKAPKMMAACTLPVGEGMVVRTETPQVVAARKSTLEFLLTNHPLDCPVCDKGGECELQDMVFRYGAGESRYTETKVHVDEKQWSPVVFFDAPRCILCFRCVRICNEGMGVGALGIVNRGVVSEIAPNHGDHLECDECGMCIDICPVGALTSGIYRYQTRPWEMEHVGTICTHCSNDCKTTLGVRNNEIIRGNNRDRSGINGEFLCIKGRYAFDFYDHPERLQSPLMRVNGKLEPASWAQALAAVSAKFRDVKAAGGKFGIIGSTRTTNEENYYLQKFARQGLGTNNIDHSRSGDLVTLLDSLSGGAASLATTTDLYDKKAVLVVAADLAEEQPFLSFQIRANYRHHQAHVYAVTEKPVREDGYAVASVRVGKGGELAGVESLRERLAGEKELVILFGDAIQGDEVRKLVAFGSSLGIPVQYICLLDYSNSRGALDMGVAPDLLPGFQPASETGLTADQMLAAEDLDVLWVVGANPLSGTALASKKAFVVVQEMFLTETAKAADVVFPASSGYEKAGTVTNVCGEVQRLKKGVQAMGTKPDLEIFGLIGKEMGLAPLLGPWIPDTIFAEIRGKVHGYNVPM